MIKGRLVQYAVCGACLFSLAFSLHGCRLAYLLQAAEGQIKVLTGAVPVEEAVLRQTLSVHESRHLRMSYRIRTFAAEQLGLTPTESYRTLYTGPRSPVIYALAASPKDRLASLTWWFPVVGRVPYLGFFDASEAKAQARKLAALGLDVFLGRADAYSTLGWFKDPLTRELLRRPTGDFVEILLHEMVHATLYLPGQGAFNEGLASMIGLYGALQFLEAHFGPLHPLVQEARAAIDDERRFSFFLEDHFGCLEEIYASSLAFDEKMRLRAETFSLSKRRFAGLQAEFQTHRFQFFDSLELNNASLLAVGLYHRHFPILETVHRVNNGSIKKTLSFFRELSQGGGDTVAAAKTWLLDKGIQPGTGTGWES